VQVRVPVRRDRGSLFQVLGPTEQAGGSPIFQFKMERGSLGKSDDLNARAGGKSVNSSDR